MLLDKMEMIAGENTSGGTGLGQEQSHCSSGGKAKCMETDAGG